MIQLFASIIGVINIVFNIKNECKMAASKIRIKKICEYCGQEFYALYNPQIEMFARFKMKSSFHKTKRII